MLIICPETSPERKKENFNGDSGLTSLQMLRSKCFAVLPADSQA